MENRCAGSSVAGATCETYGFTGTRKYRFKNIEITVLCAQYTVYCLSTMLLKHTHRKHKNLVLTEQLNSNLLTLIQVRHSINKAAHDPLWCVHMLLFVKLILTEWMPEACLAYLLLMFVNMSCGVY